MQTNETSDADKGAKRVTTEHGAILIKKACEHPKCGFYRCERTDLRIGGIDI